MLFIRDKCLIYKDIESTGKSVIEMLFKPRKAGAFSHWEIVSVFYIILSQSQSRRWKFQCKWQQ